MFETKNIAKFIAYPTLGGEQLSIDGQMIKVNRGATTILEKVNGKWEMGGSTVGLWKKPKLQGPIDDAFLDSFLIVLPSGKPANVDDRLAKWVDFEAKHFQDRWRALMRGEVRVKFDKDVTQDDHERHNLILWGDPETNSVWKKLADMLPVKYSAEAFELAGKSYSRDKHAPVLIYPNPESPSKYVVLNSGLTFREAHDKTNSQQNPKLPDWAVLDISGPPTAEAAGKVLAADFFDEQWQVKK